MRKLGGGGQQGLFPFSLGHEKRHRFRLKRQIHELSEQVHKAKTSSGALKTQKHLKEALSLTHECVPLMALCLKKNMLSKELHDRWVRQLGAIEVQLEDWLKGTGGKA